MLARRPLTGERDIRSEDRQLLLDAIGAATETLVVTYTGRGEHTNDDKPPAVPLGELLDALDRTSSAPVRDDVLVHHPLQPFDEANLTAGALVSALDRPFSFDRTALAGARAARAPQPAPRALVPAPLPPPEPAREVSLADLHDFFAHPVRSFLRQRLRVTTPYDVDETKDAIPITLDGAGEVGGRRPARARRAQRRRPAVRDARRAAARAAAPRGPRLGHAHRDRRSACARSWRPRSPCAPGPRAPSTSTSTSVTAG